MAISYGALGTLVMSDVSFGNNCDQSWNFGNNGDQSLTDCDQSWNFGTMVTSHGTLGAMVIRHGALETIVISDTLCGYNSDQ